MNYIDKEDKPVKVGDILFYNECLPYAESLHVVEDIDGVLFGRTVIGNIDGIYYKYSDDKPIELVYYCSSLSENKNMLNDALVVGNITDNPEYLTVEWATKNYPLNK